jgi:hypothetical protein
MNKQSINVRSLVTTTVIYCRIMRSKKLFFSSEMPIHPTLLCHVNDAMQWARTELGLDRDFEIENGGKHLWEEYKRGEIPDFGS